MTIELQYMHGLPLVLFFFLYAEIHFRFPGIPSRYYIKQPEIIADVPHRVNPDKKLPILLIVKDAHRFPVTLLDATVFIISGQERITLAQIPINIDLGSDYWDIIYDLEIPDTYRGKQVLIDVEIRYQINNREYTAQNDNYPQTSHNPFSVYLDTNPLPKKENWYWGDLHCHSNYTSDQVEFGASLSATKHMAQFMGVDFFAVTDHSYDLDDKWDNYLETDPDLAKWQHLWDSVEQLNKNDSSFVIIPGEELSAGNHKKQNVHFLVLNNQQFFHGSGDGAEKGLNRKPQWQIPDVLKNISANTATFASHPETNPPLLQRLLINRGKWNIDDYTAAGLTGVQMWNGSKHHFLEKGLPAWINLLLTGKRPVLAAGNDAHGNFNRFRQLSTPFWSMTENQHEIFSEAKTGVFVQENWGLLSLIHALQKGDIIVSDGPFAELTAEIDSKTYRMGDTISSNNANIHIAAESSPAFGEICSIGLYIGDIEIRQETRTLLTLNKSTGYSQTLCKPLENLPDVGYIRIAVKTLQKDRAYHCFTNPVFIKT